MTDLHALVAPYALDAIDDLDRRRFDAHLAECESCADQASGFATTASKLASAEAQAPPAHLRSRIMATVAVVPQTRTVTQQSRRPWRRLLPTLAVAAALLVPVFGATQFVTDRAGNADVTAATASVSSVLAAPDASTRSKSLDGGGAIRVVTSRARGAAVVAADGLPALAEGQTYQVWTLAPGSATSRGTFAISTLVAAERLGEADRIAVTIEPAGGSDRPTSLPVAVLPL